MVILFGGILQEPRVNFEDPVHELIRLFNHAFQKKWINEGIMYLLIVVLYLSLCFKLSEIWMISKAHFILPGLVQI